jgi:hypothetical protein
MIKTMSGCLAAAGGLALVLAFSSHKASAFSAGAALTRAVEAGTVQVQTPEQIARYKQQGRKAARRAGSKAKNINISQEHKDKIKQNIPAEYHQYLPKELTR